jgi:hypothetical protein
VRPSSYAPVKPSLTRLGGGVTGQGIAYPGGLDQTTPSLSLQPGALRGVINFECSQAGGYARIQGYERFDGQPAPSAALYTIVQVTAFTNIPVLGQTLTQATSGATGEIIAVNNVADAYYVALTKVTGGFDYTHAVSVGATPIGNAIAPTVSITPLVNAQYLALAADVYRADIGAVPGSGDILDVFTMAFSNVDRVYAFRANSGGTAVDLYKSTALGWVQIPFYDTVSFSSGGTVIPLDGATLTQSGVTATVKRVMTASGGWAGSDAAGAFVITAPVGGNFTGGSATLSGGAAVTLDGAETAITMLPGGTFEHAKYNFSGQSTTRRVYGCDGVNKAYEFDGDTLAPITTSLSPDQPSHIACHKNFLFLAQDSSIIYSAVGLPFFWGTGAGEIAAGDIVTAMITLPGDQSAATLSVFGQGNTYMLYGTGPSDFNFVTFNTGTGALPRSVQNLFDTFVFDYLGVLTLRTSLNFGNFAPNTLTKNILPFILAQRTKLVCSSIQRSKSQYRVFFSDGYGLWLTAVNQQYLGATVVSFPNPVSCCDEGETISGNEVSYFGSRDGLGYIYQMDSGPSFDGANLDAYVTLAWDALKSPRLLKRFRRASIEMQGTGYAAINFGYQLGYGSADIGQPNDTSYPSNFSAPYWDSFVWDAFVWDGQTLMPTDVGMTGTAENVQVTIRSTTNYIEAYNLNSLIYQYSDRRQMRSG